MDPNLPYPRTEPLPLDIRVVQEELSSGARLGTLFPADNGLDLFADGGAKPDVSEALHTPAWAWTQVLVVAIPHCAA